MGCGGASRFFPLVHNAPTSECYFDKRLKHAYIMLQTHLFVWTQIPSVRHVDCVPNQISSHWSTSSKSKMENVEVAPLRTLEDFLSNSARFQVPNIKDPEKWANRVTNNLLYYQTNYFVGSLIIFLLVG